MPVKVGEAGVAVKRAQARAQRLGKLGERLALAYFMVQGWWPVQQTGRAAVQVDLILRRGQHVRLVEVKTRWRQLPYEQLLSPAQRRRLLQEAARFASRNPTTSVQVLLLGLTPCWPLVRIWPLEGLR